MVVTLHTTQALAAFDRASRVANLLTKCESCFRAPGGFVHLFNTAEPGETDDRGGDDGAGGPGGGGDESR